MNLLNLISLITQNGAEWTLIASRAVMLRKVLLTKSVSGLSLKTNLLYLLTYMLRYIHLRFWYSYNMRAVYGNIIKSVFLGFQVIMVFLILVRFRKTYYRRYDNFPMSILIVVSVVVGLIFTRNVYWNYYEELCYNISLVLESVAILPQLVMTQEAEDCESMTSKYIVLLGLYRFLYLIHFCILKWQGRYIDVFMIVTALIQTGLYADFFYVYYQHVFSNKESGVNLERETIENETEENNKNVFDFQGYTKRI